jgi:hypothetical protein
MSIEDRDHTSDRRRLASILGMLGSEHAGERAAAGLKAEQLRIELGITWVDLLSRMPADFRPQDVKVVALQKLMARNMVSVDELQAICQRYSTEKRMRLGSLTWEFNTFQEWLDHQLEPTVLQEAIQDTISELDLLLVVNRFHLECPNTTPGDGAFAAWWQNQGFVGPTAWARYLAWEQRTWAKLRAMAKRALVALQQIGGGR